MTRPAPDSDFAAELKGPAPLHPVRLWFYAAVAAIGAGLFFALRWM